jgi:hypothetical protein
VRQAPWHEVDISCLSARCGGPTDRARAGVVLSRLRLGLPAFSRSLRCNARGQCGARSSHAICTPWIERSRTRTRMCWRVSSQSTIARRLSAASVRMGCGRAGSSSSISPGMNDCRRASRQCNPARRLSVLGGRGRPGLSRGCLQPREVARRQINAAASVALACAAAGDSRSVRGRHVGQGRSCGSAKRARSRSHTRHRASV